MHFEAKNAKIRISWAIPVACLTMGALLTGCATLRQPGSRAASETAASTGSDPAEWFTGADPLRDYARSVAPIGDLVIRGTALISLPGESHRLTVRIQASPGRSVVDYRGRYGLGEGRLIRSGDTLRHQPGRGDETLILLTRTGTVPARDSHSEIGDDDWPAILGVDLHRLYRLPLESASEANGNRGVQERRLSDGTLVTITPGAEPDIRVTDAPFLPPGYELILEGALTADRIAFEEAGRGVDGRSDGKPYLPRRLLLQNPAKRTRLVLLHEQAAITPLHDRSNVPDP